jgi:hypothetical protein
VGLQMVWLGSEGVEPTDNTPSQPVH